MAGKLSDADPLTAAGEARYIALFHKDAGSDYGVSFPDLPGCVTAGTDLDDARAMAAEALALHLTGMAEDGEAIPEPSSLEDLTAQCDFDAPISDEDREWFASPVVGREVPVTGRLDQATRKPDKK